MNSCHKRHIKNPEHFTELLKNPDVRLKVNMKKITFVLHNTNIPEIKAILLALAEFREKTK